MGKRILQRFGLVMLSSTLSITVAAACYSPPEPAGIQDIILEDGGDIQYSWLVENQFEKVPEQIQQYFLESGWTIIVTDTDLNQEYFSSEYSSVSGMTSYRRQTIYIQDNYQSAINAPTHEIGHWIDWAAGFPSKSEEFQKIYQEVKEKRQQAKPTIGLDNEMEIFADAISDYMTAPASLDAYPNLQEFVQKSICQLENISYYNTPEN